VTLIIALVVAPFTILTLCFAIEVLAGLRPLRRIGPTEESECSAAVVVPAHNEEAVLPATLPKLIDASRGLATVLVVADNCSDGTAAISAQLGAEVIERFCQERRGKGFALDFARDHLTTNPPDVVVIVDADCLIDHESLSKLIQACFATKRPSQATNLQRPSREAPAPVQLSTFAFYIRNVVRLRGLQRLTGRAHLLGTGMAIPWAALATADLATGNIVEDLKLGQDLATAGYPPVFAENAMVWSNAETGENTLSQRRRWEGGFLANALRVGPAVFAASVRKGDAQEIWAAINVMIPPFALLLMLDVFTLVFADLLTWATGSALWPVTVLGSSIAAALMAIALAWATGGSRFVSLGSVCRAPFYMVWKLPMYLAFARHGAPKEWRRTGRP
jgi:cellulose synthase/poly-beta-1,6-N-acetylglucosamine synthase-like glycosyltransferase